MLYGKRKNEQLKINSAILLIYKYIYYYRHPTMRKNQYIISTQYTTTTKKTIHIYMASTPQMSNIVSILCCMNYGKRLVSILNSRSSSLHHTLLYGANCCVCSVRDSLIVQMNRTELKQKPTTPQTSKPIKTHKDR